jgi:thymidylate kinase
MPKLIVITGIDGAGKTTLIDALSQEIPNCVAANVWQSFGANQQLFKSKAHVYEYMLALTPNSRLLFLAHAVRYGLEKALESNSEIILIDGYYFKYFGPELALGADLDFVQTIIESFPKVDQVICLDLPIEKALERKGVFTDYECGFDPVLSAETFLDFQRKVLQQRKHFETDNWKYLDGEMQADDLVKKVVGMIG